jgi:hypothetical protein
MLILELSLLSASPKDFDAQTAYLATYYQIVTKDVLLQLRQNEGLIILPTWRRIQRINVGGKISANSACTIALLDCASQQPARLTRCANVRQGSPEDLYQTTERVTICVRTSLGSLTQSYLRRRIPV